MISVSSKNGKHHALIFKLKKCQNILEDIIHIENISLEIIRNTHDSARIVSRYHRSNQKPYLEEGQTTQSSKGTCLVGLVDGFNNISVISLRSALLVEETRGPGENHPPAASHWQTLSHNVVSRTPPLGWFRTNNISGDIGTDWIGRYKSNHHTITTKTDPINVTRLPNASIMKYWRLVHFFTMLKTTMK